MVDFSQLLKKPAGQAVKPPVLPPADYPGIVKRHEVGDNNKNKTPYVRFFMGITDWPDSVAAEDRQYATAEGSKPIDLAKREQRRDFFLTDDALWRLDEFLRSCGIEPAGRPYEEVLPEVHGKLVLIEVQQGMRQDGSNDLFNQVGKVVGQG